MIFCQTRKMAMWLSEKMIKDGHAVALLSGELSVEERIQVHSQKTKSWPFIQSLLVQVLDRYRDGLERVLITTNVMCRGIDVEQVTLVVNYDLPVTHPEGKADCETYLHRIGRTGTRPLWPLFLQEVLLFVIFSPKAASASTGSPSTSSTVPSPRRSWTRSNPTSEGR